MLSMKTLRVAIVTMGSALLLGPGIAAAQNVIHLDGTALRDPPSPQRIATETIPAATATGPAGVMAHAVEIDDEAVSLQVTAKSAVPSGYFVRVQLEGAVFRDTPTVTPTEFTRVDGGTAGSSQVVYAVPTNGIAISPTPGTFAITVDGAGAEDGMLSVLSDAPGGVRATITAHRDQFEAIDGVGALNRRYFGGSTVIIQKVSGITASVSPGTTAVADVGTGFRWFVNDPNYDNDMFTEANRPTAHLGRFTVNERAMDEDIAVNAADGTDVEPGELIPSGVHLTVQGDLSIGTFDVTWDDPSTMDVVEVDCPGVGSEDSPSTGNVAGTDEMPNTARVNTGAEDDAGNNVLSEEQTGGQTGTYTLCVNVDTMGPMSNMSPLPITEYMGTISLPNPIAALPARELATGVVGKIDRNGASVNVAYLTDAEIYNQRLILVNRAGHDVEFTVTGMQSEDGTTVTVNDLADGNMIGAGETRVVKVGDLFSFDGKNRVGATISFNATPDDISVATSQINLDDFSTDTVMWMVK